jgi:ApbE superfamily uncharacterized protein (UPF0280 family)
MIRKHFEWRETIATVLADEEAHVRAGEQGMLAARREIERQIARDPYFRTTFEPYDRPCEGASVLRMADAARRADVGPMAAVAGSIAWAGVEAMENAGASFAVIDNGGDIALRTDRTLRVGLYAGSAPISNQAAFLVPPQEEILGICTSSATVGLSISLGTADAVVVFSHDVADADAWATACCNQIRPDDRRCLARLAGSSVTGLLAVMNETIVRWGDLPPLVAASVDARLITAGEIPYIRQPPGGEPFS